MCDDIDAFVEEMKTHHIVSTPVRDQGWGRLSQITLPGGGKLGIYQLQHARPAPMSAGKASKRPAKRAAKRSVKKTAEKKKKIGEKRLDAKRASRRA